MAIVILVNKAAHSKDQLSSDTGGSWESKSDEEVIEIIIDLDVVEEVIADEIPDAIRVEVEFEDPHLIKKTKEVS